MAVLKVDTEKITKVVSTNKTVGYFEGLLNRIVYRILFTNQTSQEMIAVIVTELYRFESFRKLFEKIPSEKCGNTCDTSIDDLVEQMRKYYSAEAEQKYGVLGIEIELGDLRSVMMEKEKQVT